MTLSPNKIRRIPIGRLNLTEEGFLHVKLCPTRPIEIDDLRSLIEQAIELTEGRPRPTIVDVREIIKGSKEIRTFAANENHRAASAVAIWTDSPIGRVLGNLFIHFSKPNIPTQLFTSEADALNWLRQFANH